MRRRKSCLLAVQLEEVLTLRKYFPDHSSLQCFKAYDIRGILGETIDDEIAYKIGRAFAQEMNAKKVVIGRDARESSPNLAAAVARGPRSSRSP